MKNLINNNHILVVGNSGSGKSTTVRYLLSQSKIPFLIIDPTYEYRSCKGNVGFDGLKIFSIGKDFAPIYFNPLYIQEGIGLDQHISNLMTLFEATLMITGPVVNILRRSLYEAYYAKGWNRYTGQHPALDSASVYCCTEHKYYFPILSDILPIVRQLARDSNYEGEVRANIHAVIENRLADLCNGAKGRIFNTYEFYGVERLLSQKIVIEPYLKGNDQAFVMSLIVLLLNEYLSYHRNPNISGEEFESPKHILVIEEAHNLFNLSCNVSSQDGFNDAMGRLTQDLEAFLRESRKYGESVIVVDQDPNTLPQAVIQNTDIKLIHRIDKSCTAYDLMTKYLSFDHDTDEILPNARDRVRKLTRGNYYTIMNNNSVKKHTPEPKQWFNKVAQPDKTLTCYYEFNRFAGEEQYLRSLDNILVQRQISAKFLISLAVYPVECWDEIVRAAKKDLRKLLSNNYLPITEELLCHYLSVLTCECIVWNQYRLPNNFVNTLDTLLFLYNSGKAKEIKIQLYNNVLSLYETGKTVIQHCAHILAKTAQRDGLTAEQVLEYKAYPVLQSSIKQDIANDINRLI